MTACMFLFELTKELSAPHITKWQSHTITIIFSTLIAALVALFVQRHNRALMEKVVKSEGEALQKSMELEQVNAKLLESEAQYARMAANVPGMLYRFRLRADGSSDFPYASNGCREIFACERHEIERRAGTLLEMIHKDDWDDFQRTLEQSLNSFSARHWEGRIVLRSGEQKWIEIVSHPERQENGDVIWDGLIRDVSERKDSEEMLRLLESAVVHAKDGIVITDAPPPGESEYRIAYVNDSFARITGYSRAEVLGRDAGILHGAKTDLARVALARAPLPEGQSADVELIQYRKDGTEVWMEMSIVPVRNETGAVTHFVTMQRDITGRKADQLALQHAKEAAEAGNKAKNEFLSRMSHELRTPLNAILGFSQLLDGEASAERREQHVKYILKASWHLLKLVDDVLDIAKIEAGRFTISTEPVAFSELLQDVIGLLRPLASASGVRIENPALTACGDHHVLADRQRLKQVLLNVVSNAIKYNREAGEVTIACEECSGEKMRIRVSDTGMGIAAEDLKKLFSPFERLKMTHTVEGTGLGLALSKQLIEAMRGSIRIESTAGVGTTCWIEMPIVESPMRQLALTPDDEVVSSREAFAKDLTVLYVEDNLANLQLIEHILVRHSQVKLISSMQGRLGIDLARQHRPDLILLDLHLPDMNGREVLRRLRENPQTDGIPVVILSADANPSQVDRLLLAGATRYLTKPIVVKEFLATLDEILRSQIIADGTN